MMSNMIMQYISQAVEKIASSFYLLFAVGFVQFGILYLLHQATEGLESEFGSKSPDTRFGYNEAELYEALDAWGIAGCNAYLNSAVLRFFFIPAYSLLLSAVLWRSFKKVNWDTKLVPQLALAMLLADWSETTVLCIACIQYPKRLPPHLMGFADLANKIKFVSTSTAAVLIFTGVVIKAYIWPLLMLSPGNMSDKQQKRAMAPADSAAASAKKKQTQKSSKKSSSKKD
jgi:hypothetical protein